MLQINSKILNTCTMFANHTASLSRYLISADAELAASQTAANANPKTLRSGNSHSTHYDPARLDKLVDLLQKYDENFSRHLKVLLDTLNYFAATETVVFLSLCARLSTASEGN